jgi:hypothetical protein
MWIQAQKDLDNQWIQLWYCIKEEDIEMSIKDWNNDWRIPILNQEIPADKDTKAVQEHTPKVPKNPRTGQNLTQQKKGGVSKKGTQVGKKNNTHAP